jgi:Cupin domain
MNSTGSSTRGGAWIRRTTIPPRRERFEGVAGTPHVMLDGKRHILGPGDHLVVPPGAYHTVGNPTAEMGHAIAAFRPGVNIHQFFVEVFEVFCTSRGRKRLARLSRVSRHYPEYIQFRKPVRLVMAVLARLPDGR